MRNIRPSSDQISGALLEIPMVSRIVSLAVIALVVIGLAYLIRGSAAAETELLFGGRTLGEQEIDSVEMAFSRAKLAGWKRDGRKIRIPTQSRTEYLSALDETAALPMSLRSSVQEAIDKASLFEPTSQREARERHAKERDLGNKLTAFPDIQWASVEHDIGERVGLSMERTQSASVVVCPEGDRPLPPARTELIREFIRGSYAGMRADDVVVIDTNADPTQCPTNDPIVRKQCEEEAKLKQEVQDILQGYGTIRIAAYVEIRGNRAAEQVDESPSIVRQKPSPTLIVQSEPEPNLLNDIIEAVTHVSSNRAARINDSNSVAQTKVSVSKVSPDQPALSSVRLSVGIPESYYQRAWQSGFLRQHPGTTVHDVPALAADDLATMQQSTKANITTAVKPALLSRVRELVLAGGDPTASVDVWTYPDLNAEPAIEPNQVATGVAWATKWWRQIAIGVLASVVVLLLVGSVRPRQQTSPEGNTSGGGPKLGSASNHDDALSDELSSLIDQHPDLASETIRQWLAEAA